MEQDGRATPTPSRLHSPSCSFNQADEEMVAKPLAERGAVLSTQRLKLSIPASGGTIVWTICTYPLFLPHQTQLTLVHQGAEIVQLILDHGKLQSPDIISRLFKPILANIKTLYKPIFSAYIKPSTLLLHHSPRDKRIKYEAEEKTKIAETAEARLKREEEEAESVGLKRKPEDLISHRSSKDDVYFRVNFDKFNTHIRNKLIEMAVGERFNQNAALVIGDRQKNPTSTAAITMLISADDDLLTGLVSSTKKASRASLVKDNLGLMSAVDNPTPAGKAASFISLADNIVHVEFEIVSKCLRRRVPKAVARERHGDVGVRIVRLLLDIGKMDDKQIAKVAKMPNNVVRPLLGTVPRSADRNPTRTFYLWHVDLPKAYSVLLGHLYKTLYNIGPISNILRRRRSAGTSGSAINFVQLLYRFDYQLWTLT
ncbi:uncharacterized protein F5891DRAFT_1258586 [Suillus fuscotomentosus]|uniref:DNA-directed RNA polymerase III subunit RPC3 n=1 Tax=Suillus fuscotomentosus TaxID=1912939 RepID=A0AAD4DTA4_9AGAM|nr:uncharacterized protein F5891DRAFT_1258586 [Suillus fuscotomentosus]KAG1893555.1 hypothetical protein F5891DRAFT_1258586 [Suillus fuscotomentosus]